MLGTIHTGTTPYAIQMLRGTGIEPACVRISMFWLVGRLMLSSRGDDTTDGVGCVLSCLHRSTRPTMGYLGDSVDDFQCSQIISHRSKSAQCPGRDTGARRWESNCQLRVRGSRTRRVLRIPQQSTATSESFLTGNPGNWQSSQRRSRISNFDPWVPGLGERTRDERLALTPHLWVLGHENDW